MDQGTTRPLLLAGIGLGAALLVLALLILLNLPTPVTLVLSFVLVMTASGAVGALVAVLREGQSGTRRA